jgi:hypothetical protein
MSNTPLSDELIERFPQIADSVLKRLARGKVDYGDASLRRPLSEIASEIQQEAEDIMGWGALLHSRLTDLIARLKWLEGRFAHSNVSSTYHVTKEQLAEMERWHRVTHTSKPLDCQGVEPGGVGKVVLQ